ncbi:MAG: ExeA family protein [Burkholderiales bacterium]
MYEAHFGLNRRPFSLLPEPGFIYFSRQHRIAADMLEYGLAQASAFSVVTGAIGTGKTTLLRNHLRKIKPGTAVGAIASAHPTPANLLRRVLHAFSVENSSGDELACLGSFEKFLATLARHDRRALLLIDEAQNFSVEGLEALRMLTNVNTDKTTLQVLLIGQPGLRDMLRRPELEQLAQRVQVDYHIEPLDGAETDAYIRHRLGVAGANGHEVISETGRHAIFEHSGGVPRLVNILCDTALVYGYAAGKKCVDREIVQEVAGDRRRGGILPLAANASS